MPANLQRQTFISGLIQLIVGSAWFILGVVETTMTNRTITSIVGTSIWTGLWIIATGIIGVLAGRTQNNCCRSPRCMYGVYMGFSITSIVMACMMIITSSLTVTWYAHAINRKEFVTVSLLLLIAGLIELGAAIWGVICTCATVRCCSNSQVPTGQVVYMQTQEGAYVAYVVVQGSDGAPLAVPAQPGGPMVAPGGTPMVSQGGAGPTVVPPFSQQQLPSQSVVPVAVTTQSSGATTARGGTPQGGAVTSLNYQMSMQQQRQQQQHPHNDPPKVAQ